MVRIEIRMLGPLQVRRVDGTAVTPAEWRTAKTLDLLRLLALHNGEAVPVGSVVAKLWPDVDEARGRASLRTAASQLRKVLGEDCVDRRQGRLLLVGAWVDTQAYESLLSDARASRRSGDHARTVATVEEAEALYVGDLDVPDSGGEWLEGARDRLRRLRCRALLDAADAAAALRWMRDSLELAERAAGLDSCEEAARALMRALAGVGELQKALAVFDRVRRDLVTRYGVDPSPQTRALHLQLLTGTAVRERPTGLVGHTDLVEELAETLLDLRRDRGGVVWLQGEPGSGRDAVTAAAAAAAGLVLRDARVAEWFPAPLGAALAPADLPDGDVVLMPHAGSVPSHSLRVVDSLARQHGGVLVVPVTAGPSPDGEDASVPHRLVQVQPLAGQDLGQLAEVVLQGMPTGRLLRSLRSESRGLGGLAARTAREWLGDGRVVWSVDGLDLADSRKGHLVLTSVRLRRGLRLMSPFAEDVVHVLALAGTGLTTEELVDVVSGVHRAASRTDVEEALEQLAAAEYLVVDRDGYRLRDTHVHAEIAAWMRPQLRQLVRGLLAERVGTPREPMVPAQGRTEVLRLPRRMAERFYGTLFAAMLHPEVHTYAGVLTTG